MLKFSNNTQVDLETGPTTPLARGCFSATDAYVLHTDTQLAITQKISLQGKL